MRNAIELQRLHKSFDHNKVINNCNLNIEEGEIFGLLGSNGAGKTTLFKLITHLVKKDSGGIKVLGIDIDDSPLEILQQVGLLIDTPVFYEHLSGKENLEIHLAYMGIEGDIEETLTHVGLSPSNPVPVSRYSLGMRGRLALARAIIHNPKLLLLDEPLNGLDPQGIRDMRSLLKKLSTEQGKTILLSSHTLSEVEHIADSIGVLFNGTVKEKIHMKDIQTNYRGGLEDYYFHITKGDVMT